MLSFSVSYKALLPCRGTATTAFLSNTPPSFGIGSGLNASSMGNHAYCLPVFRNLSVLSLRLATLLQKSITCVHCLFIIILYPSLKHVIAHQLLHRNQLCTCFESDLSLKCRLYVKKNYLLLDSRQSPRQTVGQDVEG